MEWGQNEQAYEAHRRAGQLLKKGVWTTSGFCQTPSADIPNIAGTYVCKIKCGCKGNPSVEQTASGISLTNECGDPPSPGQVTGTNSFTATGWGLTGNITDSNSRLTFSD